MKSGIIKFSLLACLFMFLGLSQSFSQNIMTGRVLDTNDNPIYAAVIKVKGTDLRVLTAKDGTFSFTAPALEVGIKVTNQGCKPVSAKATLEHGKGHDFGDLKLECKQE